MWHFFALIFGFAGVSSAQDATEKCPPKHTARAVGYGPLSPVKDRATGLELLELPEGFEYISYGWTGQMMHDGVITPTDHDGMGVVGQQDSIISMVRNHEQVFDGCRPLMCPAADCSSLDIFGDDVTVEGGTTTLHFDLDTGMFVNSYSSLGETVNNCAGGVTAWGTWISAEESWVAPDDPQWPPVAGYLYEVPGFTISNAVPIRSAGRFTHEAIAVDPKTGVVYETEDNGASTIYKYVAPGTGSEDWIKGSCVNALGEDYDCLADGGDLYYMVVTSGDAPTFNDTSADQLLPDHYGKDMRGSFENGATFQVEWKLVGDPLGEQSYPLQTCEDAAIFARGEGAWFHNSKFYFISTSGGNLNEEGNPNGPGQVWSYEPETDTLTMVFQSPGPEILSGPDNVASSPRKDSLILCEDGASNPKRLIGLRLEDVAHFEFAKNNVVLAEGDIDLVDAVYPGVKENFCDEPVADFRSREFAGATFHGDWLFVNIQSPGITFAITGPWQNGDL